MTISESMPNTVPDQDANAVTPVHVAVAVIVNGQGEVLIARRPDQLYQGGLWEFPGGKLEPGERVTQALSRELDEELGITVESSGPLIRVHHHYPRWPVLLDVWRVERYRGEAHGREGQPVVWVNPEMLQNYHFPAANIPIVTAARLPERYLVTPEPGDDLGSFLSRLEHCLSAGVRLVQLRAKRLGGSEYAQLARRAIPLARRYGARLLLNADPELATVLGADGIHITSKRLLSLEHRPLPAGQWVAASCHDEQELAHAARIGVDFAVVSPVLPTPSHPGVEGLGWERLFRLTEMAPFPLYALGGMSSDEHLQLARSHGAQGIAAIRGIWGEREESLW